MKIAQEVLLYYAIEDARHSPEWPNGFWPKSYFKVSERDWDITVNGFFRDLERAVELMNE